MNPKDLKLQNGIECIDVDEEEKVIGIIVPEGWKIHAMPTDSGQELRMRQAAFGHLIEPERVRPAPKLSDYTPATKPSS